MVVRTLVVLGVLGLIATSAMAQPGGGGGPGGGRGGFPNTRLLDQAWTALFFELKANTDQLTKLLPVFQQMWDDRKAAQKKMQETRDFQAYMTVMQKIATDIDAKLKEVLTEEQFKAWEAYKSTLQMGRGGPGGGAPGGGGAPPAGGGGGQPPRGN